MGEIASKAQLRMAFLRWALVLVPLLLLLGFASAALSGSGPGNLWYAALAKPALLPPPITFMIVWSILYVLMGFALAIVVTARRARLRGPAIAAFVVQLLLNLAWSPLFFVAHQVMVALVLMLILLVALLVTVALFWRVRALAGGLLLPCLAWVAFAAVLNYQIDQLNPNAERLAPGGARTQISL